MGKRVVVASIGVLFITFCGGTLVYGVVKQNQHCFTKPKGDPSGGADCTNKACWSDGGAWFQRKGTAYTKCGFYEPDSCNENDPPTQNPACAQVFSYMNQADCLAHTNYGVGQIIQSGSPGCT